VLGARCSAILYINIELTRSLASRESDGSAWLRLAFSSHKAQREHNKIQIARDSNSAKPFLERLPL
jgi:hypothetical protein